MDSSLSSTLCRLITPSHVPPVPHPQLCSGLALLLLDLTSFQSHLLGAPSTPSTALAPAVPGTPSPQERTPSPQLSLAGSGPCWLPWIHAHPIPRSHLTQRISCAPASAFSPAVPPAHLQSWPRLLETKATLFCLRAFGGQGKGRGGRGGKLCILSSVYLFPWLPLGQGLTVDSSRSLQQWP